MFDGISIFELKTLSKKKDVLYKKSNNCLISI